MNDKPTDPWPPKAYNNLEFLNSPQARQIRILCELEETEKRFKEENIEGRCSAVPCPSMWPSIGSRRWRKNSPKRKA